jgi:hypothetical protein
MVEQQLVSRAWARRNHIDRYFTGKPCKRGHIAERITHSSSCVACQRESAAIRNRTQAADAARYRHIREHGVPSLPEHTAEALDRAVDDAIASQENASA